MVEAFQRYAGIDLLATMDADGATDAEALAAQMRGVGLAVPADYTWSYLFSRVLVEKVEPNLGLGRITVLDRYPAAEAALARRTADDPRVAERFELYACGVELANGFGELTDAAEQRRRFAVEMDEKQRLYGETLSARRGLARGAAADAGDERRGAGLRPAGDAGDRRAADRGRAVGAGRRRRTDEPGSIAADRRPAGRGRAAARGPAGAAMPVAQKYAIAITPAMAALIDRDDPDDPIARQFVPDRARADDDAGGAGRPDRRPDAFAGRGDRASLSGPGAAQGGACVSGLLPVLLPARDGRAAWAGHAVAGGAGCGLGLYRGSRGDLGGDPHRRRSAGAVAAATCGR